MRWWQFSPVCEKPDGNGMWVWAHELWATLTQVWTQQGHSPARGPAHLTLWEVEQYQSIFKGLQWRQKGHGCCELVLAQILLLLPRSTQLAFYVSHICLDGLVLWPKGSGMLNLLCQWHVLYQLHLFFCRKVDSFQCGTFLVWEKMGDLPTREKFRW
jgi:hypothetical protein